MLLTIRLFQPFYLPLAFFVPPSHAIVHMELNLLYQFWIHTELVRSIGPLEYIFNTILFALAGVEVSRGYQLDGHIQKNVGAAIGSAILVVFYALLARVAVSRAP